MPEQNTPVQGYTAPPRTLNASKIAILIIANLTPLSVIVGTVPLALVLGGPSLALMYVASGIVIGLFCVGYSQMVRKINRPGAFFNYVTRSLGGTAGVSAAMIAVVSYLTGQIGAFAVQAMVTEQVFATMGLTVPWQICLAAQMLLVTIFALRKIDVSSTLTFIIVGLEVVMLGWMIVAAVMAQGSGVLPLSDLGLSTLTTGHWSVAFVFAILCFAGFEAGALYSSEAKNPGRSVPRGLYGALIVLTVCFALSAWLLGGVAAADPTMAKALTDDPSSFVFVFARQYMGAAGTWILSIASVLSQVACALASTNFVCRYLQSLSVEGLLPRFLERKNRSHSPSGAIIFLAIFQTVVILGLAAVGISPYLQVAPIGFGLSALGATLLQAMCSVAVIVYFVRARETSGHLLSRVIVPAISIVVLVVALVIELGSFQYITGSDEPYMVWIPLLIPAIAFGGWGFGVWLKRKRPDVYAGLAAGDTSEEAAEIHRRRRSAQSEESETRQSDGALT